MRQWTPEDVSERACPPAEAEQDEKNPLAQSPVQRLGDGADSPEPGEEGPRSSFPAPTENKSRDSSLSWANAFKHGLFTTKLIAPNESPAHFESFRQALIRSLRPQGEAEVYFVEQFIALSWRLRRAGEAEGAAIRRIQWAAFDRFDASPRPPEFSPETWAAYRDEYASGALIAKPAWMQTITRFEAHLSRQAFKNLAEFQKLKAGRKGRSDLAALGLDSDQADGYGLQGPEKP